MNPFAHGQLVFNFVQRILPIISLNYGMTCMDAWLFLDIGIHEKDNRTYVQHELDTCSQHATHENYVEKHHEHF
eukprot:scaffold1368_cov333-Pavlova_lutheri.AAC.37